MKDPQQVAFCIARRAAENIVGPDKVFDTILPSVGAGYPFFYIGETFQTDNMLKNSVVGTINVTVHFWTDEVRARGSASEFLQQFKSALYESENTLDEDENIRTDETKVHFLRANSRILADNSTAIPLLHGVIELYFSFS